MIARVIQRAEACLRSIAEPVVDAMCDLAELVIAMLGVSATFEHCRIVERTARRRAEAESVKFGRKPILTSHQQGQARRRVDEGEPQRSVGHSYNVGQAMISRLGT